MSLARRCALVLVVTAVSAFAGSSVALAQGAPPPVAAKGKLEITWLGHAAFELVSPGGARILIDPFIKGNPSTPAANKDLAKYTPDAILLSHSHGDHEGDAVEIAKKSKAAVIGAYDHIGPLAIDDKQKMGGNVGGTFKIKDVSIHLVPAMHGSNPGGRPLGFVIKLADGRSVYHSGDTWVFSDMALIEELFHPTILLLNTGGGPYTQDPATAAFAVKKFWKPQHIIPMHYGTFPPLATEDDVKRAFSGDKRLVVMKPGETRSF